MFFWSPPEFQITIETSGLSRWTFAFLWGYRNSRWQILPMYSWFFYPTFAISEYNYYMNQLCSILLEFFFFFFWCYWDRFSTSSWFWLATTAICLVFMLSVMVHQKQRNDKIQWGAVYHLPIRNGCQDLQFLRIRLVRDDGRCLQQEIYTPF